MTIDSRLQALFGRFRDCLASDAAEGFLGVLLELMALAVLLDPAFRRNVHGFNARYLFKTKDGKVAATAIFGHGLMEVVPRETPGQLPDITVEFRDAKALVGFLLARDPDIIGAMMRQDVTMEGNLNYLYKFAYMARHLQSRVAV